MARDKIHDAVKQAVTNDGWTITHDPYPIKFGRKMVFVDLAAEKLLAAEKDNQKIAIEIKSFIGHSATYDIQHALGQYQMYTSYIKRIEPERHLYLAISRFTYDELFQEPHVQVLIEDYNIHLIVVDLENVEITTWID